MTDVTHTSLVSTILLAAGIELPDGQRAAEAPGALVDHVTAAAHLGVSPHTIRTWTRLGTIPSVRLGGRTVRYRIADLDAWIEAKARRPLEVKPRGPYKNQTGLRGKPIEVLMQAKTEREAATNQRVRSEGGRPKRTP